MTKSTPYLIIGAGIHGLSTAAHLAKKLKATGKGSGADILVIDKAGIAAGASGIACGVVRNNYFQPAMRELMAHSVQHWEANAEVFQYNPVGYLQISAESMREDVGTIYQQQKAIGYESEFIEGAADSDKYMKAMFDDWSAQNITSVLHEKKGGFAHNAPAIYALAKMAEDEGVRIQSGITVNGMKFDSGSGAVTGVETDKGDILCDHLVVAAGPWVRDFWTMAELPKSVSIKGADGAMHDRLPMWTFWQLEEGVLRVDPQLLRTNEGKLPPVIHVDTDAPLISDVDGSVITEEMWGIYYKPDTNFGGIQGGAMPYPIHKDADEIAIDPYGPSSPEFVSSPEFAHMWVSALAHCNSRFKGTMPKYHKEASGGVGCFTPDSFPVFDTFRENVYMIADSNHGYKMIGVGELVAQEILGEKSALLEPFRFSRYAEGKLHPVSNSPYPWS
ncbi:FAD-binding oxidoreductase [Leisingera sp. ANG59]|uniref:NAD(P)/FAD-dependent oxidoreductase n=1 Tax=Leisingera sp. ANG59 TaxID=2675221 RepID=UPI0015746716|nr:FAD-binding oxidoreductase [Leisingera sp. ANG59]NSY39330.1 FAD-dependent oxidoreductase [Leisingera sp. ANG59]